MAKTQVPSAVAKEPKGVTTGQAFGTLGIGATIGAGFGYLSGLNEKKTLQIQRNILKIQADMERQAVVRELQYMNEKYSGEGWAKKAQMRAIMASQRVGMAASGFVSMSAGDARLLKDTHEKYEDAERAANKYLFQQAFEKTRGAEMKALQLKSQADQLAVQSKYSVISSTLSGFAQGLNTGTQMLSIANTFYRNNNNMEPMGKTTTPDVTMPTVDTNALIQGNLPETTLMQLNFGFN